MSNEEIDKVENKIRESFPDRPFHILLNIDGSAEVWEDDRATGICWTSMNTTEIPEINKENIQVLLEDLMIGEIQKYILRQERQDE